MIAPPSDRNGVRTHLDGRDLLAMFSCATRLLERNVESINALNVFPVPDGDTGTNMFLTMRAVVEAAEAANSGGSGEVVVAMARGALMGARGNSGVILSQFFAGAAARLKDTQSIDARDLAGALRAARDHSYRAVGEPVEGTLLTVITRVAETADECAARGGTVREVVEAVSAAARTAVAETPAMLPVLRQAGVVDAGGHGLAVILEGARRALSGEMSVITEIRPPDPVGVDHPAGSVSVQFLDASEHERYGYCTQFVVEGESLDADDIRERVVALGRSVAVVGDDTAVRVHVHAEDPGPLVTLGASLGVISNVKIDNMDRQHREFLAARRASADPGSAAVVAVAWGSGLEELFAGLGAAVVLRGGDTMNPSVQEIVAAVDDAPADNVILLPNNRNIVPAAEQARGLTRKRLEVVPTTTIPEGVSAILAYNVDRDVEANLSAMKDARSSVRTGEITNASRSADLDGVKVAEGQTIGLLDNRIVAAGDDPTPVLASLLAAAGPSEGDVVTLYWGGRLTEEDARAALSHFTEQMSGVDVELVHGGQPHYDYIVSIE